MVLQVSPTRRVKRFGKKGKLSLRFVGPFVLVKVKHMKIFVLVQPRDEFKILET